MLPLAGNALWPARVLKLRYELARDDVTGMARASKLCSRELLAHRREGTSNGKTVHAPADGRLAAAMATIWDSRRPIREDALRSKERTCRISSSSICAGGEAHRENGLPALTSRDHWENSNVRFAPRPMGSGFIAAFAPTANEIFSSRFGLKAR
jgi:hypothetical protein